MDFLWATILFFEDFKLDLEVVVRFYGIISSPLPLSPPIPAPAAKTPTSTLQPPEPYIFLLLDSFFDKCNRFPRGEGGELALFFKIIALWERVSGSLGQAKTMALRLGVMSCLFFVVSVR